MPLVSAFQRKVEDAGRISRRSWRWGALGQKKGIDDFALAHDIDVPENPQYTRYIFAHLFRRY